jgi:VWFA-related protein
MFSQRLESSKRMTAKVFNRFFSFFSPALLMLALVASTFAQSSSTGGQNQQPPPPQQGSGSQQAPPAAGGPAGDVGPMAIPKKKEEPPEPPKPKVKNPADMPDYSLRVDVPLVNVDVTVRSDKGDFIPGLKKENFRVLEDGVPQNISNFSQAEAPITAVLLVEFASTNYRFIYDMLNNAYAFATSLKQQDWAALISYDMKPQIVVDFTQDKRALLSGINSLRIPMFSETNLFDALYDTLDRLERIEGHKYIILISTGCDSFSKLTFDQVLKKVKGTRDTTIYAVSIGQALRLYAEARGLTRYLHCTGGPQFEEASAQMDFLQADNQMSTFAKLTGGKAYFPRFEGQLREIIPDIGASIRNQYLLAYKSSNPKLDGSYRKIKVELVGPDGSPLKINVNGKKTKYQVLAREGYTAKHVVE